MEKRRKYLKIGNILLVVGIFLIALGILNLVESGTLLWKLKATLGEETTAKGALKIMKEVENIAGFWGFEPYELLDIKKFQWNLMKMMLSARVWLFVASAVCLIFSYLFKKASEACTVSGTPGDPPPVESEVEPFYTTPAELSHVASKEHICPQCGAPVRADASFCKACGAKLQSSSGV